jgi:hypothetical protein
MSYAYKFTDTHVRKHPTLVAIAIEYAKQYCGEFEPMLDAQDCLRRTGVLPIAQARKVLNILRQEMDPDVASLQVEAISVLEETRAEFEAEVRRSNFEIIEDQGSWQTSRRRPGPGLSRRKEPEPERPWSITTKLSLKVPYIMVRARSGAIHRATSGECQWNLPCWPQARHIPSNQRAVRTPEVWVYTACGNSYYGPPGRIIFLAEPSAPERRPCVRCFPT